MKKITIKNVFIGLMLLSTDCAYPSWYDWFISGSESSGPEEEQENVFLLPHNKRLLNDLNELGVKVNVFK